MRVQVCTRSHTRLYACPKFLPLLMPFAAILVACTYRSLGRVRLHRYICLRGHLRNLETA